MHVLTQPVIGPLSLPIFFLLLIVTAVMFKFIQATYNKSKNVRTMVGKAIGTFARETGVEYESPCVIDGIRLIPPTGKAYEKLTGIRRVETLPNVFFIGPRRADDEEFEEVEVERAEIKEKLAQLHNPVNNAQIAQFKKRLDQLRQKEFMMIEKPPVTWIDWPRGKGGFFGRMETVQVAHYHFREISADPINFYGQTMLVDPIVLKAQLSQMIAELVVKTIGDTLDMLKDLQKSLDRLRQANATIVYLMLGGAILLDVILLIMVAPKMGAIIDKLNLLLTASGIPVQ